MERDVEDFILGNTGEELVCEECGGNQWKIFLYHALERVGLQCGNPECRAYGHIDLNGSEEEEY